MFEFFLGSNCSATSLAVFGTEELKHFLVIPCRNIVIIYSGHQLHVLVLQRSEMIENES
jgi:hypothetical protein